MAEKNMKASALVTRAHTYLTELTQQPIPSITKFVRIGGRLWYWRPQKIDWTIKHQLRAGCYNSIASQRNNCGCGIFSSFDNYVI